MQIQIEIISVGQKTNVKTARGGYDMIEVAYKKDGKIEGKKIMSFTNPKVFADVQTLKQGTIAYVETTKGAPNAQGQQFWQWDSISGAGSDAAQVPTGGEQVSRASYPVTQKTTTSSYPTTEERAAIQVYIVRQSAISTAVALASAVGDKKANATTIIAVAKEFEAFVMGKAAKAAKAANEEYGDIADMADDIPL